MVLYLGAIRWRGYEDVVVESVGSRPRYRIRDPHRRRRPSSSRSVGDARRPTEPAGPRAGGGPGAGGDPGTRRDTKIFPVGLDKNKAIEIPEDIRYVGWYELGVPPGVDRGSAVLVAHRDGREQGRGVFYFLGNLDVGDKVVVKTSAGEELPYKVVSRESILKKRLPYEELFAVDGDPRLTLISCGGYYDPDNGGYQDNVVVTAVPMFDPIVTDPIPSATPPPRRALGERRRAGTASPCVPP